MNYCTQCGAKVELRIPEGDTHLRHVCRQCGEIHYLNPKLVIGCIAEWNGNILLCRRAIEPRHGFWTLPAGFMENGESTVAAALRETLEEACARVEIDKLAAAPGLALAQAKPLHTKPPARYSEATLLGAMESAGKQVEDEELDRKSVV